MTKNSGNRQRRWDIKRVGAFYKRKFTKLKICIYCGMAASVLDHVYPLTLAARLDENVLVKRKIFFQGLNLVPACGECNTIAGMKPFISIREKRRHIQGKLREKYILKIRTVYWDDSEIQELGPNLKREVLKMINNRKFIESRIYFPAIKGLCNDENTKCI